MCKISSNNMPTRVQMQQHRNTAIVLALAAITLLAVGIIGFHGAVSMPSGASATLLTVGAAAAIGAIVKGIQARRANPHNAYLEEA